MATFIQKKTISIAGICMFSIIAVDSIRTLPISAEYGFSLVFFYLLAGILFLIPCAFVSAELASTWPQEGGLYVWIRQAFGQKTGFMAAWLLWVYNMVWFPTIVAFICMTAGAVIFPDLMQHKLLLLCVMLALFWLMTAINCFGVQGSAWMSTLGVVVGTLLPMLVIVVLALNWYLTGQPLAIHLSAKTFFPSSGAMHNLGLLTDILFGLMGIEVAASFAGSVKNPKRNFPIAMFLSVGIILLTLILGSLAIAIIVPQAQLNLATGVIQSFSIMFARLHMPYLSHLMVLLIFIGSLGGLSTWMAGPSRNMMVAARDGVAPKILQHTNRFGAASHMLVIQGVVFSLMCSAYVIFPYFNSAYALLSAMSAQLAILVYLLLFAAAIRLRYSKSNVKRAFSIPGGRIGMWFVAGIAWLTAALVFVLGFLPPSAIHMAHTNWYEWILITGVLAAVLLGWRLSCLRVR